MTRDEIRARFKRVVARGLARAAREEREHLARIRAVPMVDAAESPAAEAL